MQKNWLRVFLMCVVCAVCLHGNCAAADDLTIPPTALPIDDSNEVYDMTQMRVRYVSSGYYGAEESTFILSYEKSANTANIGRGVSSNHNGLPDKWYKMTDENDRSRWVAFTYDTSNGIFTMYHDDQGIIDKFAYRKFRDDNLLESWRIGEDWKSAPSGQYVREGDGIFWNEGVGVHKYITDGMLIFLNYVIKEG